MSDALEDRLSTPTQLLVYGFEPGAKFEGRLVGATERVESGGTLRVLDVLFVMRDADTADLVAIEMRGRGEGSLVAPLLGFRLDPGERRRASEKALGADAPAGPLRRLGETLEPGAAVAAVLVEHVWVRALDEAVSRTGGKPLSSELVDAASFADLTGDLPAAAGGSATQTCTPVPKTTSDERKHMAPSTNDTPVLDLLKDMTAASLDATSLDEQTLMLVRIAALIAVDAPPVSYAMNLEAAAEVGLDPEKVRGVLAGIAPIVGTVRVVSATSSIAKALALEIEIEELTKQGSN